MACKQVVRAPTRLNQVGALILMFNACLSLIVQPRQESAQ
ncbi:hypothetical protein EV132_13339 [Rhizobium sullae]|uniref:Uncharacterized protein n=1 Tax=Rhizobium sullae TaxID=50338 RepID=A0A4V2V7W1_RHISU|nr:hypothetical protein EV132_13339 [Rhizobium sullae]